VCSSDLDAENKYFLVKEIVRTFHPPQTPVSEEESFLDKKMVLDFPFPASNSRKWVDLSPSISSIYKKDNMPLD
jgi:hypothetical protein